MIENIQTTVLEALIHAFIYYWVAIFFTSITIKKNRKREYIERLENTFIYTNTYYPLDSQFKEECEAKLKSDILWLERNKDRFDKNTQKNIQIILDYAKKWKKIGITPYNGTQPIYIEKHLSIIKNDIDKIILLMNANMKNIYRRLTCQIF